MDVDEPQIMFGIVVFHVILTTTLSDTRHYRDIVARRSGIIHNSNSSWLINECRQYVDRNAMQVGLLQLCGVFFCGVYFWMRKMRMRIRMGD